MIMESGRLLPRWSPLFWRSSPTEVILSLLTGIFVGYAVINHSIIQGIGGTLNGIIETFASAGNARTIVFMLMIGGIMRLIVVTGGVRKLVQFLSEK